MLVHVLGPRTSAVTKPVEADVMHVVSIRFKAGGAYPFFGVPISALTDRGVSIETLWGRDGTALREALASVPCGEAAARVLETALAQRRTSAKVFEPAAATSVRRGLRRMRDAEAAPRIDVLARELGVSVAKVQTALDWDEIALASGYHDRSHLISDFRTLAGATPASLRRTWEAE